MDGWMDGWIEDGVGTVKLLPLAAATKWERAGAALPAQATALQPSDEQIIFVRVVPPLPSMFAA